MVYWWSPRGQERVFDVSGWPDEAVSVLQALLDGAEVDHRWEGTDLVVAAADRDDVAVLRLLLGAVRDHEAGGGDLLLLDRLQDDVVSQRDNLGRQRAPSLHVHTLRMTAVGRTAWAAPRGGMLALSPRECQYLGSLPLAALWLAVSLRR